MPVSGETGLNATIASGSQKLDERRARSALTLRDSPPGFCELRGTRAFVWHTNRYAAVPVFARHFATVFRSAQFLRPADVLFRSGPEITS